MNNNLRITLTSIISHAMKDECICDYLVETCDTADESVPRCPHYCQKGYYCEDCDCDQYILHTLLK